MRTFACFLSCLLLCACGVSAGAGDDSGSDGGTFGGSHDTGDGGTGDAGSDGDATEPDGSGDDSDAPDGDDGGRRICGNGILEFGESCDDGNNFPGDGCSADCHSTEECGNGVVDLGESCDDGNVLPGDGCDSLCRNEEGCGNGTVEIGEQCDDSNVLDGDGCNHECQREISILTDGDGDGISDFDEGAGAVDTDGDGLTDDVDDDSDDDGVSDALEAGDDDLETEPVDTDRDGTPDFRDQDADNDLIDDAVEGSDDLDGDGLGCHADSDCDGDYVPDSVETTVDSDRDGIPDYRDTDSDDDGILDEHELFADSDFDGTPNRLDSDSDDDGLPDHIEAGDADPASYPIDFDGDGLPDYIDLDSDDDGLPDSLEHGCSAGESERHDPDSDDDGFSDLAETLVLSDPCSFTTPTQFREFTDFFFILPDDGPTQTEPLEFSTDIVKSDIHINIDSSGSMDGEIANLRSRMSSFVVPRVAGEVDDVAFGVSDFRDCTNWAFRLRQRITTNVTAVQSALNALGASAGSREPTFTTLWHIGSGVSPGGCTDIPNFNPAAGRVPGVADGTIGGVGFRNEAFPIVIHVTDEFPQDAECGGCAKTRGNAISSLNSINARMIGVAGSSGTNPRGELRAIARGTDAIVPVCAWDGARPSGCGATQCCTGINGSGQGSEGGMCPLVFDIAASGAGLSDSIVTGVVALVNTTTLTVTARLRRDEDTYRETGVDTRCFIESITPNRAVGAGACSATPTMVDILPVDGIPDSFADVTPGTSLYFDVAAQNRCVTETDEPQAFFAYIDVIGDGVTVLDTQSVTIIVPADSEITSTVP